MHKRQVEGQPEAIAERKSPGAAVLASDIVMRGEALYWHSKET